jgi:PleD family two-component response regulator
MLPRTSVDIAYEKAHTLRKAVESYEHEEIPKITVSVGVTAITAKDRDRNCFKRVDDALYQAKIKRNDVVLL